VTVYPTDLPRYQACSTNITVVSGRLTLRREAVKLRGGFFIGLVGRNGSNICLRHSVFSSCTAVAGFLVFTTNREGGVTFSVNLVAGFRVA